MRRYAKPTATGHLSGLEFGLAQVLGWNNWVRFSAFEANASRPFSQELMAALWLMMSGLRVQDCIESNSCSAACHCPAFSAGTLVSRLRALGPSILNG